MLLPLLDILLLLVHLAVILFNLLGWIWRRTRKIHLYLVVVTLFSWVVLGLKYGWGYCFLTDWHWDIKRQLGEDQLPASFIHYLFEQSGIPISTGTTDGITLVAFLFIIIMTLYVHFFRKDKPGTPI